MNVPDIVADVIFFGLLGAGAALPLIAYLDGHLHDAAPGMWIVCAFCWVILILEIRSLIPKEHP